MPDFISRNYWILVCLFALFGILSAPGVGNAAPTSTSPPITQTSPKDKLLESQRAAPLPADTQLKVESISLGNSMDGELPRKGSVNFTKIVYAPPMAGVHVGFLSGQTVSQETPSQSPTLGLVLFLDQIRASSLLSDDSRFKNDDLELNVQFDRLINLGYSRKWFWDEEDSQRPYLKVGLFNHIDSSDLIAGFINFQHFKIRSALGFADFWKTHERFYLEIAVSWGQTGVAADLHFGHTFRY